MVAMQHNRLPFLIAATLAATFAIGTPLQGSEADDQIESVFQNTYVFKTYLKDDAVRIDVDNGVVTLTGTVVEASHKALAQETAASLTGVTEVFNRIKIPPETESNLSDPWIASKVKLALMFHRHVGAIKTMVAVKGGVVTLTGEASSLAQQELTTAYAKDIDGVTQVKNLTKVVAAATEEGTDRTVSEAIDDASITAQVKTALQTHRSTHTSKVGVTTQKCKVSLTGIATNESEKALIGKLVEDIRGVTSIDNQMTIGQTSGN